MADPTNHGFVYRLNRDHVLVAAVEVAMRARATVLERLASAVEALVPAPTHVAVFGSFARGDGTPHSDIDVLVLLEPGHRLDDAAWVEQMRHLGEQVLSWTGNRAEMLVLESEAFSLSIRTGEPIIAALLEESIQLQGLPLEELVRRQAAHTPPDEPRPSSE
ncbi:Nucleotidyltransferase domain-containing protein [Nocardioides scoriae]|uniref:Nucleotidyltransferase domain-containing protein n=1 Tax=Nocardioides scoriae TaxID=642780 RepID=A0A1H1VG55_9ACTN|nr:nucleotidyltransferase domain-containing protein [Nocardioides scoriae]SDS83804.1 Nucleotidyltransferase domain-containing protein [Nocardioides scoriae]